jgi:hypothetical protein
MTILLTRPYNSISLVELLVEVLRATNGKMQVLHRSSKVLMSVSGCSLGITSLTIKHKESLISSRLSNVMLFT